MMGALRHEGAVVGVLANDLMRAATSGKFRKYLLADNLTLVIPFNPEASFNVGNAMARNHYIYCLAEAAIVVSSASGNGGTWHGAARNLKENWVDLWVKRTTRKSSGNRELVMKGASWLPDDLTSLDCLLNDPARSADDDLRTGLAGHEARARLRPGRKAAVVGPDWSDIDDGLARTLPSRAASLRSQAGLSSAAHSVPESCDLFLDRLARLTAEGPMKSSEIAEQPSLRKRQVDIWLKRGVEDKEARKARELPVHGLRASTGVPLLTRFRRVIEVFKSASSGPADIFALRSRLPGANVPEHSLHVVIEAGRILVPNCVNFSNDRVRLCRRHDWPP